MKQPANAQRKHNRHATCAKVDIWETMPHHCSVRRHAAFKGMALIDSKTAQCTNTDMSHLHSQHAYSHQLLKSFPFPRRNNGAQVREFEGLNWYWALLNVGRRAFTLTADGHFHCGPNLQNSSEFVCVCERTLRGDSRYLGPTDIHLALQQPSNSRPCGMLRNVTSWRRSYCAWAFSSAKFQQYTPCFVSRFSFSVIARAPTHTSADRLIHDKFRGTKFREGLHTDQNSIHFIQGLNQFEALIWEMW